MHYLNIYLPTNNHCSNDGSPAGVEDIIGVNVVMWYVPP